MYNDGSIIPKDTAKKSWYYATTPKFSYYNNTNNLDSIKKYGALYNWYVVETGKLAPKGWRIPDTTDWNILENYLISNGYNWDKTTIGNKTGKSLAANTDWATYATFGTIGNDLKSNNRSGFSALPGGFRDFNGYFYRLDSIGIWWSTTDSTEKYAYYRSLNNEHDYLYRGGYVKNCGFSIRLIKD